MKGHRLVADRHDHFEIAGPDGKSFKVAKNGLSAPMVGVIAKLPRVEHKAEGGEGELEAAAAQEASGEPGPLDRIMAPGGTNPFPNPVVGPPDQPAAPAAPQFDMTANSRPGDDAAAAQPMPGAPAELGAQTFPTPTGAAPPGQEPTMPGQPSAPGMGDPGDQYLRDLQAASGASKGANNAKAAAEGLVSDASAKAADEYTKSVKDANDAYAGKLADLDAKNDALYQQVAGTKIDPNHMWNSASTGSKLGMLAGILISGAGANAGQGNMAMQTINKAVEQDIEAQKSNLSSKENLLHYNLQRTHDLTAAQNETRLNLLATFKGQVDAAAARQGSAIAKANAAGLNAQIDMQMAGIKHQIAFEHVKFSMMNGTGGGAPATGDQNDPDRGLVQRKIMMGQLGVPGGIEKGDTEKVMDELGQFDRNKKSLASLDQNFSIMEQNHGLGIGNGPLASEAKKRWEAAAAVVGTTVDHELAGRVTETTLAEIKNNLPRFGDSPQVAADRRNALMDAVKLANSKEAKGYGRLLYHGIIRDDNPYIAPSAQIVKAGRAR